MTQRTLTYRTTDPVHAALAAELAGRFGLVVEVSFPRDRLPGEGEADGLVYDLDYLGLDARGRQFTSEEFANLLRDQQDRGTQNLFFAVGPADGFSDKARAAADLVLSFGKMTLAHELARVVLLEQLYRAFTILKGHPYHCGH